MSSTGKKLEIEQKKHPDSVFGRGAGEPLLTQKRFPRKNFRFPSYCIFK